MTLLIHADDLGDYSHLSVSLNLTPAQVDLLVMALRMFTEKKYINPEQRAFLSDTANEMRAIQDRHEQVFAASHPKSIYTE